MELQGMGDRHTPNLRSLPYYALSKTDARRSSRLRFVSYPRYHKPTVARSAGQGERVRIEITKDVLGQEWPEEPRSHFQILPTTAHEYTLNYWACIGCASSMIFNYRILQLSKNLSIQKESACDPPPGLLGGSHTVTIRLVRSGMDPGWMRLAQTDGDGKLRKTLYVRLQ